MLNFQLKIFILDIHEPKSKSTIPPAPFQLQLLTKMANHRNNSKNN